MRKAQAAVSRGPQPRIALVGPERVAAGGDELDDAVEVGALEAGVGSGGDDLAVERVRHEWPRAGRAPHVLGEDIERALAVLHGVVVAVPGRIDGRPAFQHLEAVGGHQQRLRGLVEAVVGAPDALDQPARALGRADIDDEVDVAPVDAEVERGGAHHGLERAGGHGGLDLAASRGVERAVVQRDGQAVVVDAPQLLEHQLGLAARVDEHEAEPVRLDGGVDLGDGVAGGVAGPGQRQLGVEDAHVGPRAAFGDDEVGEADGAVAGLRLEVGAQLARPRDRRRQADAGMAGGDGSEPGKIERQQVAALGGGERMQLIEDDGGQPGKELRRVGVGEQQGHLLGRCEQHVGRADALARLARGRGIAGARLDADRKAHLLDRSEQVAMHVGGERLERRDIERVDAALPLRRCTSPDSETRLGRKPASVLPAPVGAISRVERRCAALSSRASWCARGCQPRRRNQAWNAGGSAGTGSAWRTAATSSARRRGLAGLGLGLARMRCGLPAGCCEREHYANANSGASAPTVRVGNARAKAHRKLEDLPMDRRQFFGDSVAGTLLRLVLLSVVVGIIFSVLGITPFNLHRAAAASDPQRHEPQHGRCQLGGAVLPARRGDRVPDLVPGPPARPQARAAPLTHRHSRERGARQRESSEEARRWSPGLNSRSALRWAGMTQGVPTAVAHTHVFRDAAGGD